MNLKTKQNLELLFILQNNSHYLRFNHLVVID